MGLQMEHGRKWWEVWTRVLDEEIEDGPTQPLMSLRRKQSLRKDVCCPGISGNMTTESLQRQALALPLFPVTSHSVSLSPHPTHSILQVHMGETNWYYTLLDTPD